MKGENFKVLESGIILRNFIIAFRMWVRCGQVLF